VLVVVGIASSVAVLVLLLLLVLRVRRLQRRLALEVGRRRAVEAVHRHQTRHDPLTGLANREHALLFTATALAASGDGTGGRVAVLIVGLDRFKLVNESRGHEVGDRLLEQVARRLQAMTERTDLVARAGGDEFVVVADARTEDEVVRLANRVLDGFQQPVGLGGGTEVFASTSMGVALARTGDDARSLFAKAEVALSRAKERGRSRFEWFDEEMQIAVDARAEIEHALRYAIAEAHRGRGGLELWYQPIVDLTAGTVRGFESLVRWRRGGQLLLPADFVAIAEDSGLIVALGDWIVKEACAQAGRWQRLFGDRPPMLAVNVSGRQLASGAVPQMVQAGLSAHQLDPALLTIELTESVLLDDVAAARDTLDELKALGVTLAIDDFGTGYSSLRYLREFPIDVVKVDRSFVRDLGTDTQDSTIVAAVIAMASALQLRVVCEGVETAEQVASLLVLGAHDGQGWFFSKALPADEAGAVYANGLRVLDGNRYSTRSARSAR